jgi:hypothetical protein
MKKYTWHEKSICTYYYETKTGKIVADYSRINFSDDVFHARVNCDNLGQYISEKCARTAVEEKVKQIDEETERCRKSMPCVA